MLTGRKPYIAETPAAILLKQATEELPRPSLYAHSLPEAVEKILIKALARDPHNRYEDMGAFARALENTGQTSPAPKPRERTMDIQATMDQGWGDTHTGSGTKTTKTETLKPAQKGNEVKKQNPIFWVLGAGLIVFALIFFITQNNDPALTPAATETPVNIVEPTLPPTVVFTATNTPLPTNTAIPEMGISSTMTGDDGMTLMYVPAGEFTMGSDNGEYNEKPVHRVFLDAYWIDQTEVTNGQYAECVTSGGCTPPPASSSYTNTYFYGNSQFDDYPVIRVYWNQAQAYCEWAGRRLPTEAEWEKAARGENGNIYPWGNTFDGSKLNFCDANCSFDWADKSIDDGYADVSPVGNFPNGVSPYGAYDMAGNVWEWVNDWYGGTYYQGSPSSNPSGAGSGDYRVLRGGSWYNVNHYARSVSRKMYIPSSSSSDFGFRCSRSQ